MKPVRIICFLGILFQLSISYGQGSDKGIEKIFSATNKTAQVSHFPDDNKKITNYYWIDMDTLYSCINFFGKKIALSDIDFNTKKITKSTRINEITNENVYTLTITAPNLRSIIRTSCNNDRSLVSYGFSTESSFDLDMQDIQTAENAFRYLKASTKNKNSNTAANKKTSREKQKKEDDENEEKLNKLAEELDKEKAQSAKTKNVDTSQKQTIAEILEEFNKASGIKSPSTNSETKDEFDRLVSEDKNRKKNEGNNGNQNTVTSSLKEDFETQLLQLINGLADNFSSLKGSVVKGNQFLSKVQLSGSVSTKIIIGMMGITTLNADFGDFVSEQEATSKYNEIINRINGSNKYLNTLVEENEIVSSISKTKSWLPIGSNDKINPAIKRFSLNLEMVKSSKFDKNYNKQDYYFVQLKIAK